MQFFLLNCKWSESVQTVNCKLKSQEQSDSYKEHWVQ